ncbi:MAG: hypothetical protein MK108_14495 [Mariniblastus sp.]|nr:hypothetical protein [Mariniblastus sp.]
MRYGLLLMIACLLFAQPGCTTPAPIKKVSSELADTTQSTSDWITRTLGKGQASDPRARDIEQRLGYSDMLDY